VLLDATIKSWQIGIKPKENSDNIILVLLKDKKVTDHLKVIHNIQEAF